MLAPIAWCFRYIYTRRALTVPHCPSSVPSSLVFGQSPTQPALQLHELLSSAASSGLCGLSPASPPPLRSAPCGVQLSVTPSATPAFHLPPPGRRHRPAPLHSLQSPLQHSVWNTEYALLFWSLFNSQSPPLNSALSTYRIVRIGVLHQLPKTHLTPSLVEVKYYI